ncbi:SUF system NifU family Fe-S cluster assembly protein [Candidatus Methylospira mobilis]|uniref:SUF system NifU family Fe-S cluster assembly protein n=1 Tax=Candidatus Methylospira mobilis TaxID=1808979 RepID=A0A5Q0BBJ3_9GAMM|nr:SUF system NifU family Fe-S cluster assembly protein [Candidatus Methylospira mobilis]QFY41295.1 SUF system NifU family Fe-S cluster assembly protein [Candidatus Methylospira mobilis]WNV05483.1 SUF system NifU family Fe-S cluster assembly protein [Candidatus Methylospira mobilis]
MLEHIRDLYQEVVFDHNRNPRNFRVMEDATRTIEGFNPLCGDRITLYVKQEGDVIKDVSFQGQGCAISTASASLMTEIVKEHTEAQAHELFELFHRITTGQDDHANLEGLGKLAVLAGVRAFPARVKCATLAWHSLEAALKDDADVASVTTE